MSKRPSTFKLADVQRAAKAVRAAGLVPTAFEFDRAGTIRVITAAAQPSSEANPWDAPDKAA